MNTRQDIDNFNIFELMGMADLGQDRMLDFLNDMQKNIWTEFILTRLDKILTEEDLITVNQMVADKNEVQQILAFIKSKAPNFEVLLLEFTRDEKIEMIRRNFQQNIEESSRLHMNEKTQLYQHAQSLLEQNNWEQLKNLWQKAPAPQN